MNRAIVFRTFATCVSMCVVCACATSHVVVGDTRAAISPSQVHVYLRPPEHFEEVALLDASSQFSWATTDQQKTDKVIERLKEDAAKLGANGVLLEGLGEKRVGTVSNTYGSSETNLTATTYGNQTDGHATTYGSATTFSSGIWAKNGKAVAIYVPADSTPAAPVPSRIEQEPTPALTPVAPPLPTRPSLASASPSLVGASSPINPHIVSKAVGPCSGSVAGARDCISLSITWDIAASSDVIQVEGELILTTSEGGGAKPVIIEWPLSDADHLQPRYSETIGLPFAKLGADGQWLRYVSDVTAEYRMRRVRHAAP